MDFKKIKKDCMKEEYAKQICEWNYLDDYGVYNLPNYEKCIEMGYGITKKEQKDNYVVYLLNDEVLFYLNMKPIQNKIEMGVGLKPKYCGQGIGNYFLNDGIQEIKKRYSDPVLFLEVRSWNIRAIKSYKKIGFKIEKTILKKDRNNNEVFFTIMTMS